MQLETRVTGIQQECEAWLVDPLGQSDPSGYSARLLERIRNLLEAEPDLGSRLGPLIGRINSAQRHLHEVSAIAWVPLAGGSLAIGHRPGNDLVRSLRFVGTTHVLTLLTGKEGAEGIGILVRKAGMVPFWFPMASADPPDESRMPELRTLFSTLSSVLDDGGRVYLHCSAGIHRTGMMAFAFLRYLGLDEQASLERLGELRSVTRQNVGANRISWASEQFGS